MMRIGKILAVGLWAAGLATPAQEGRRGPFEVRHLAPYGRRVDTQFYDFTGDGLLDALVVSIDLDADPPNRWFALHAGRKDAGIPEKPDQIWSAAPATCAFALGNVVPEGGVELLELAPDGVFYHAFEKGEMTEEPRKLLHTATFFTAASSRSLPMWTPPVDLSNDKLDDLVIPVPDGYKVYFQTAPGLFGVVQKLEADLAPGQGSSVAASRFAADWERLVARGLPATAGLFNLQDELPRVTPIDINGDGLKDLASIAGDRMTIFFQRPGMKFSSGPKDRIQRLVSTLGADDKKKDAISVSDTQFADIDGDGIVDFIVTKIEGEIGLLTSIKTRIYYHLGTGRGSFQADANLFIDGISLNPAFIDMNGDGALDVLTSRLRTDIIAKGVESAFFGDITVTYEVFQFDRKTRSFASKPVYDKDVFIRMEDIRRRGAASRPLFQVPGDLSGDGRPDAVLYDPKTSTLEVRRGRSKWEAGGGRQLIDFEMDAAAKFEVDKDHDPKWISYMDVDGDKKLDVLLNYSSQMIILLSRFK
ncbi:MAG TPA: VCBS repeat-containing protein [Planctomycetota bacterium]|nr:VCBS repeat-containing protein [Planctomycetota bacterium]